jgi:AraC family transcriptional regulator of adaptative response / DNA-3-methyladenine glycosylase II
MNLEPQRCYRALAARDARFDGLFFVGVTTTGIYCRPVCTARTPGRDRCRFFPSAAAAEQAGFRPCLRCRPELAPGSAPVDAAGRLARAAAARIDGGALDDGDRLEALAVELGVSSRHLRRAVRRELGVSPIELAQTHRLLLAKQLLTETRLPFIQVAFASGFASVRRFNALFRSHYRLTPGQVRRSRRSLPAAESVRVSLSYRPPLAWRPLLRFLADRALAGVEIVEGRSYGRTVALGKHRGWVRVEPHEGKNVLTVEVSTSLVAALAPLLARLRHLFDLSARPDLIAAHLGADPRLGPVVRRCPGLRVPGAFCGFDLAVRAILGQQVSVPAATTLAGRLAAQFGEPVETPFAGLNRAAPTPEALAQADAGALARLGLPRLRAESLRALAQAVAAGRLRLGPGPTPEDTATRLLEFPGVGPWTAQYIAMRAAGWPDAFPEGDLGLRKALGGASARQVRQLADAWRPWRAYAAMHLWTTLNPIEMEGAIRA